MSPLEVGTRWVALDLNKRLGHGWELRIFWGGKSARGRAAGLTCRADLDPDVVVHRESPLACALTDPLGDANLAAQATLGSQRRFDFLSAIDYRRQLFALMFSTQ
jgi:hypothetical protein